MQPRVHSIEAAGNGCGRVMASSQPNTFDPGRESPMTMVATPKKALTLALEPMVKKWCSQTVNDRIAIDAVA